MSQRERNEVDVKRELMSPGTQKENGVGLGSEWQESGPLGRKGGAPNWEEAGAARESTATNED
jgi:hypothetical protein